MTTPTLEEQAAELKTESFKDGEPADGAPTAEEQAAHDADQALRGETGQNSENGEAEAGKDGDAGAGEDESAKESKPEGDEKTGAETGKEGDAKPAKGGKGKSSAERIGDLTANWRSAQREADTQKSRAERAEAELAALKAGKSPLTSPGDTAKASEGAPDPSQFEYGELDPKYIAALARHETHQALKSAKAEDDQARQAAAADAKRQETAEKQDKLVRAGLELHDDFDEVVMQGAREGKWDLSPTLGELILDSEHGPSIAYALASDPTEAARVAKLSPSDQARFFGAQEAKFEAAKPSQGAGKTPPKTPQAPPPPKTPRGNSGQFQVGADSSDFAAVERAWRGGQLR